jgi:hypothetical protein
MTAAAESKVRPELKVELDAGPELKAEVELDTRPQ